MDWFQKFSTCLLIILASFTLSQFFNVSAIPAPGRNSICEPGGCATATGACTDDLYLDGTTPVDHPTTGAANSVGTAGQDFGAFLTSVNGKTKVLCFEPNTYTFSSTPVIFNNTKLQGSGVGSTIFKAAVTVAGTGSSRGLIELGDSTHTTVSNIEISNIKFDLTANTDAFLAAIHQSAGLCPCAVQHLSIHDLSMDLSTQHPGVKLEDLGHSSTVPSFDIHISNIYFHNSNGPIQLTSNAAAQTSLFYDVKIENIFNVIDVSNGGDDRIAISCNFPTGGATAEARQISVRDIYVNVTASVTNFPVNGVKFDTGVNCYMHDLLVDGIFYMNNPSNTIGAALNTLIGSGSKLQGIIVRNVWAENSGGISIRWGRANANPSILIDGFNIYNFKGTIAAVEVYDLTAASGDESVIIRNGVLYNTGTISGNLPVGIMLTGGANQGGSGEIVIDGVTINNFGQAISDGLGEGGSGQASPWTNIYITNVKYISVPIVSLATVMKNSFKITNSPGLNPFGAITNPFSTAAIGIVGLYGTLSSVTASTDYTVNGLDIIVPPCTGGTGVSITVKDGGGNTVVSGFTCASWPAGGMYIPYGYKINYGGFSVAPSSIPIDGT